MDVIIIIIYLQKLINMFISQAVVIALIPYIGTSSAIFFDSE